MKPRRFPRLASLPILALAMFFPAMGFAGAEASSSDLGGSFQIAQTYSSETPEYCERQYQECLAKCAANPDNQKDANSMTQCRAYCESVHSGCGK